MAIRKPKISVGDAKQRSKKALVVGEVADKSCEANQQNKTKPNNTKPTTSEISNEFAQAQNKGASYPEQTQNTANMESALDAFRKLDESIVKTQVFLSADVPASKVSKSYDVLSRRYQPSKALQMVLRRALTQYEHMLAEGTFRDVAFEYEPALIADKKITIQTSRMMPVVLVDIAWKHFDPLGFESMRSRGHMLGTAALAAFFSTEID